jgi:hypothetical protein
MMMLSRVMSSDDAISSDDAVTSENSDDAIAND